MWFGVGRPSDHALHFVPGRATQMLGRATQMLGLATQMLGLATQMLGLATQQKRRGAGKLPAAVVQHLPFIRYDRRT